MAETHLACPNCDAPAPPGPVQITGHIQPYQCPNCGEMFPPWLLRTVRGLHSFLAGPFEDDLLSFSTPYIHVPVSEAGSLQSRINSATSGATFWLDRATYSQSLTIPNPNITILGCGLGTILTGNILITTNQCSVQNMSVRGTGQAYAIKIFNPAAGCARNSLHRVWMGGSAEGAHDGADKGLWLDGAIITQVEHCQMAFNNTHGVYTNTTDPSVGNFSTNVNTFYDCSINKNNEQGSGNRYGVELTAGVDGVAGMSQHHFIGGNIEDADTSNFKADLNTHIILDGVDFESGKTIGSIVDIATSNPVTMTNCNFIGTGGSIDRAFAFFSCGNGVVTRCRASGTTWNTDAIGVFDPGCVNCVAYDNNWSNARAGARVINKGAMRGIVA